MKNTIIVVLLCLFLNSSSSAYADTCMEQLAQIEADRQYHLTTPNDMWRNYETPASVQSSMELIRVP